MSLAIVPAFQHGHADENYVWYVRTMPLIHNATSVVRSCRPVDSSLGCNEGRDFKKKITSPERFQLTTVMQNLIIDNPGPARTAIIRDV